MLVTHSLGLGYSGRWVSPGWHPLGRAKWKGEVRPLRVLPLPSSQTESLVVFVSLTFL